VPSRIAQPSQGKQELLTSGPSKVRADAGRWIAIIGVVKDEGR
jgi:hypothetical protein